MLFAALYLSFQLRKNAHYLKMTGWNYNSRRIIEYPIKIELSSIEKITFPPTKPLLSEKNELSEHETRERSPYPFWH